jgi:hypothetical protein
MPTYVSHRSGPRSAQDLAEVNGGLLATLDEALAAEVSHASVLLPLS